MRFGSGCIGALEAIINQYGGPRGDWRSQTRNFCGQNVGPGGGFCLGGGGFWA
jgi:hypothetical protein